MSKTINRKIRFYAIDWTKSDGSHVSKNSDFLMKILTEKRKVDYGIDEQVIISKYSGVNLTSSLDSAWVLSRVRNTDFPQISDMNGEQVEPLTLGDGKGLRDPAHFIIFENGAIIGAESNRQSRDVATTLQFILSHWVHDFGYKYNITDVSINRIRREKITPDTFTAVRSIKIQSSLNYTKNLMKPVNSIKSILDSNAEAIVTIGVDIPKKRNDKRGLNKYKDMLRSVLPEADKVDSTFSMLKIEGIKRGGNGKYEVINVLDDVMVVNKAVVKLDNNTKGVLPEYMYKSIIDAYYENMSDIEAYLPKIRE